MTRPKILVADDHTLIAEALKRLLEPEFEVVAIITDGRTLLSVAPQLRPDVIVLDLGMPDLNGMQAGVELKKRWSRAKLIVLTMNTDAEVAREVLVHWASGYVLKQSAGSELVTAIRQALRGRSYVTSQIARRLDEQFIRDPRPEHKRQLTKRQREVLIRSAARMASTSI